MSNPVEINYLLVVISSTISFVTGGAMGAVLNRYFLLKDRRRQKEIEKLPEKLTLKTIKETVISHKPVNFEKIDCTNLNYKEFVLRNNTIKDIESCEVIFEFDKESKIAKDETISKTGIDRIKKREQKQSEFVYELKHFNRTNEITFKFHIANFSMNFFSAVIDKCTGVELEFIEIDIVEQPSIQPCQIVSKEKFK
jgi:predicted small secreted protein